MIKSKWSKKNKWNYKINVQPEKNETKVNINIRSKKGLWDGEIVEDKIFLKFKGKNDKEQKKYGDCELLFTNQFWSANNIETAKVDKKDLKRDNSKLAKNRGSGLKRNAGKETHPKKMKGHQNKKIS